MNYDLDLDFDNTCRVCLMHHEKLLNLFTTQIVDGYIKTMPEIVYNCLDIVIKEEDILPKKICESCKSTIISYFTFKEKCKRTEKVLSEAILKTVVTEEKDENSSPSVDYPTAPNTAKHLEAMDKSIVKQEGPIMHEELIIDESFDDPTDLNVESEEVLFMVNIENDHITKEGFESMDIATNDVDLQEQISEAILAENETLPDDSEEYFCTFCDKVFLGYSYLDHCQTQHSMCTECYATYNTDNELCKHINDEHKLNGIVTSEVNQTNQINRKHNNSLFCEICNKRWSNREQLNHHMKLHAALNITADDFDCFSCEQCRSVFLRTEELEKHMKLHEIKSLGVVEDAVCTDYQFLEEDKPANSNELICGYCKVVYSNMNELRSHIIIHNDSFSCPFEACGCEYETFSRLSLHIMKKHVYGDDHFCSHCRQERFETFDDLQSHIRDGCTAKKFACHHCEKKFFSNKALQLHLKQIDGKKFECSYCQKTFAQHGELTIHTRTHTGERPFKCTICSKTYKTASMRAAHMDAHIDGKTFQCTVCDKMLQSRTSYRNHMKRHTVGKSYQCEVCTKRFYTKYHVHMHTMKIHNKVKAMQEYLSSFNFFFGFLFFFWDYFAFALESVFPQC